MSAQLDIELSQRYYKRRATIRKIYRQQKALFETGKLPKDRIVSIQKNYIRLIVKVKKRNKHAKLFKKRATRLEGSFGKEKEYYHLKKVKARTKKNEKLWIFFGIHTANALEIGRRMSMRQEQVA